MESQSPKKPTEQSLDQSGRLSGYSGHFLLKGPWGAGRGGGGGKELAGLRACHGAHREIVNWWRIAFPSLNWENFTLEEGISSVNAGSGAGQQEPRVLFFLKAGSEPAAIGLVNLVSKSDLTLVLVFLL